MLLDFGARIDGYCGDLTRTVVLGVAERGSSNGSTTRCLKANSKRAGGNEARCGMSGDRRALPGARSRRPGYDDFGHGLGHGLGLEVHESTRALSRISEDTLEPGMVVTNEPGLYLEDTGGVRIEDCVLITETVPRC